MKNIKEIKPVLTAIYCINRTGAKDEDVEKIIDYAFRRILGCNTNMLKLCCVAKTKEDVMPEINQILSEDTAYDTKQ